MEKTPDDDDPMYGLAMRIHEELEAILAGLGMVLDGDLSAKVFIREGSDRPEVEVIRRRSTGEVLWEVGPRLHRED